MCFLVLQPFFLLIFPFKIRLEFFYAPFSTFFPYNRSQNKKESESLKSLKAGEEFHSNIRQKRSFYRFYKNSFIVVFLAIMMIFIGAIIGIGTWSHFTATKANEEKGSFVEQVKQLSSLATAEAYVKAVIEKEDNEIFGKEIKMNIPGTKRHILLIVPGTVIAGIDLEKISEDAIEVQEEEKRVTITLPKGELIHAPSLHFDDVQTFSVEGVFRSEVDWEEGYELAEEAKQLIEKEAIAQGLLEKAEENAEKVLKEFFSQLGYKATIQYEK